MLFLNNATNKLRILHFKPGSIEFKTKIDLASISKFSLKPFILLALLKTLLTYLICTFELFLNKILFFKRYFDKF